MLAQAKHKDELLPIAVAVGESPGSCRKIWLGYDFVSFWLTDALFLDSLDWVSGYQLNLPLERWVGIDIDDIFQPNWNEDPDKRTVKIQRSDVLAMIQIQKYWSRSFFRERFHFTLGFNSRWFEAAFGSIPYNDPDGDRALVEFRRYFRWFDHMPGHDITSDKSESQLVDLMNESRDWASRHDVLPSIGRFATSPCHFGVSPIYDPLYRAWRKVWDIRYSATGVINTGFEHGGIKVIPRVGCGMACWSDRYLFSQLGQSGLDASIRAVMDAIVVNRVASFVSHQSDYARDRIAAAVFSKAFGLLDKNTRLQFRTARNDRLAEIYFKKSHTSRHSY